MLNWILVFIKRRQLKKQIAFVQLQIRWMNLDCHLPDEVRAQLILNKLKIVRSMESEVKRPIESHLSLRE